MIEVHDEADGVAAGPAAEAVVKLAFRLDAEGGCLLVVEGAAGLVVLAGPLEANPFVHDLDDVYPVQEIVDECLRYQAGHREIIGENSNRVAFPSIWTDLFFLWENKSVPVF